MSSPAPKYKKRKKWSHEDMAAAIKAVREKKMGFLKAADTYNVPRTTLFRLVKDTDLPIQDIVTKKIGRKPVFDKSFEDMLVKYALHMEDKLYGLTQMDMRRLAYQLAVKNNVPNPFNDERAGRYWLKGFLSRHKHILSMRKPSGTSFARANGFTREKMDEFYDNLEKVYDETNQMSVNHQGSLQKYLNHVALAQIIHRSRPKRKRKTKIKRKIREKEKGKGKGREGKGKGVSEEKDKRIGGNTVEKKDKNKAKTKTKTETKTKTKTKTATKRKILQEEYTDSDSNSTFISDKSEEELSYASVKQPTGDDCECMFCNIKYGEDRKGEEWVQCFMCECWVHSECAGYESGSYVCDFCKD
ncbi:hypothetical protein ABMA27_008529 [Loxostege sticticalis]|uniref:HTH CENPB-type domain-containing protein n=1 Tax=Loxostege sticticalis TaxID=481309 RepID=A0ABR3HBN2_LOXSC